MSSYSRTGGEAWFKTRNFRIGIVILVIICALVALILGLVLGLSTASVTSPGNSASGSEEFLLPCLLSNADQVNKDSCNAAGCAWMENPSNPKAPRCIWSQASAYALDPTSLVVGNMSSEAMLTRTTEAKILHLDYLKQVKIAVTCMQSSQLRIKYYDPTATRYEVPLDALNIEDSSVSCAGSAYNVEIVSTPYPGVVVSRKSSGAVIFNSSTPGFAYADQFLQLTIALNSSTVYGFGEHNHGQLKNDMDYATWTIFSRDAAPVSNWNLYGHQTLYMNVEADSQAHGVFLLNSNAMDVLLHPDPHPAVTYRTIGGILDFYIFLGPSPENVIQQYTSAVGRMTVPPYWSLGFMLSRWGYTDVDHIKTVVDRNIAAGIPLDVIFGDIDYMQNYFAFTYNNASFHDLPEYVNIMHDLGIKFVIILDPGMGIAIGYHPYDTGIKQDVFIKNANGSLFVGEVWPGLVNYPDYTKNQTTIWWQQMIEEFYNGTWANGMRGVQFDGLWVDMNEPSHFVDQKKDECLPNKWNDPPFLPKNLLGPYIYSKTLCMDTQQAWGKHYDVHSLYGHSMSMSTNRALRNLFPQKRPFVLTRSNFAGTARYAAHWLGDNQSTWEQLQASIIGLLEFSMFGFGHIGADICGFWYETEYELCLRWSLLGAFYPFSRNHNAKGDGPIFADQDPAAFNQTFINATRFALQTRYRLLPYLYTLFYQAHVAGSTVARPLLHEFVNDPITHTIDKQFLWGSAVLISPVLTKGQQEVNAYFPQARWFDFFTKEEVSNTGSWVILPTPFEKINVHVRGGYVLPWQESGVNTIQSRKNDFGLIAALNDNGAAEGELFYDDGESPGTIKELNYLHLTFTAEGQTLRIDVIENGYAGACNLTLSSIQVWGIKKKVVSVTADVKAAIFQSTATDLEITSSLNMCDPHVITWSYTSP